MNQTDSEVIGVNFKMEFNPDSTCSDQEIIVVFFSKVEILLMNWKTTKSIKGALCEDDNSMIDKDFEENARD